MPLKFCISNSPAPSRRQRGAALLATILVLTAVLTAALFATSDTLRSEQRAVASDAVLLRSFAAAENALNDVITSTRRQLISTAATWRDCATTTPDWRDQRLNAFCRSGYRWLRPAPDGPATLTLLRRAAVSDAPWRAIAEPLDAGPAIRFDLRLTELLSASPAQPLLSDALVAVDGEASLVADAGPDDPPAAADGARLAGCSREDFFASASELEPARPVGQALRLCRRCRCPDDAAPVTLSPRLDTDARSATLLAALFDDALPEWAQLRETAAAAAVGAIVDDCDAAADDTTLLWIDGDCTIAAGATFGSPSAPRLLIVDGGLRLGRDATLFGIVILIAGGDARFASGSQLYGTLAAPAALRIIGEDFSIVASVELADRLRHRLRSLTPIAGSWADYL